MAVARSRRDDGARLARRRIVFCGNCGATTSGRNFCSECGASLREAPDAQMPSAPMSPDEWANEVRYAVIITIPAVRERIAADADAATAPMSALTYLDLIDRALPAGAASSAATAMLLQPLYSRMGFKTSKERAQLVPQPIGLVLAVVLCRLARGGYPVRRVHQGTDGCVLECVLPADYRASGGGELIVTVERAEGGTGVRAVTNIRGQLIDWGKSREALDQIFINLV
jgi:hypothetical protein